ncbi:hydrogenase maturation protease [Actinomadura alba]
MKVLVAGVGDVLLSDDGFGVEVARRLARDPLPGGVRAIEFGARAARLAAHLLHGCELLVLIDTVQRGGEPGTLYVIESDGTRAVHRSGAVRAPGGFSPPAVPRPSPATGEAAMGGAEESLDAVVAVFRSLGGDIARIIVVACEPTDVSAGVGLTVPVARAVDDAVVIVRELLVAAMEETPGQAG